LTRAIPAKLFWLPLAFRLIPVALSAALGIVCAAYAGTPRAATKASSAPAKSTAAKTGKTASNKKAVTAKALTGKTTAAAAGTPRTTTSKSNTKTSKATATSYNRRSSQQQPTPERYQEIQQALAARGYFEGPADGQWGSASVEALKRFQREQSLTDDGKIGSLSLIALGLGPHRAAPPDTTAVKATQP
jgi:peptidoglycan hydrolase-like protein with peptidoglycan-binding domain